ncbi:antibiotic biosynthesis monooxygenase family protein [Chloroflexota bacterium]
MYSQMVIFKTAPGKRAAAEQMADQSYAALKGIKGFKGATYFGDSDNNEYGALYLWESKEVLDAVMKEIMPKMQEATNAIAIEPPIRRLYEIYEPKS